MKQAVFKNFALLLIILLSLLAFVACGPTVKLQPLTPMDVKVKQDKTIFVMPQFGYDYKITKDMIEEAKNAPNHIKAYVTPQMALFVNNTPNISAKIEDYLQKKGWKVLAYHKCITDQNYRDRILRELGQDPKEFHKKVIEEIKKGFNSKEITEINKKIAEHPTNWFRQSLQNADYILYYEPVPNLKNLNELKVKVALYKMKSKLERQNMFKKDPFLRSLNLLAEKVIIVQKNVIFTSDKAADYIATQIIMSLKEYL